jgi:hypothetical protein
VIIGEVGMGRIVGPLVPQIMALKPAAQSGAAFCEH